MTQSVTDSRPMPLDRLLGDDPRLVQPHLPQLIGDIAGQLDQLGRCTDDQPPVKDLLWKYHDRGNLEKAWGRPDVRQVLKGGSGNPLATFDQLRQCTARVWVTKRSCTHGDLNATNVAVDRTPVERPKGYIFDAAGIHADIATRDFAVLEVTTLLFLAAPEFLQHFPVFRCFYTEDPRPPSVLDTVASLPPVVQNTFHLLSAIRTKVREMPYPEVYPLVVFDTVMIQLGGLTVQPSKNKIASPVHACLLASWAGEWVNQVTQRLLVTPPPQ